MHLLYFSVVMHKNITNAFLGVGLGLHYYISCSIINEYFFENRLLAEGVVGSGIGFGTFIFSILLQHLSNNFTWKVYVCFL